MSEIERCYMMEMHSDAWRNWKSYRLQDRTEVEEGEKAATEKRMIQGYIRQLSHHLQGKGNLHILLKTITCH